MQKPPSTPLSAPPPALGSAQADSGRHSHGPVDTRSWLRSSSAGGKRDKDTDTNSDHCPEHLIPIPCPVPGNTYDAILFSKWGTEALRSVPMATRLGNRRARRDPAQAAQLRHTALPPPRSCCFRGKRLSPTALGEGFLEEMLPQSEVNGRATGQGGAGG